MPLQNEAKGAFFFLRGNAGLEIVTITVTEVIITMHVMSNETTGVLPFFLHGRGWKLQPIQFEIGLTILCMLKGEYNNYLLLCQRGYSNYYYTLSDKAPWSWGLVRKVTTLFLNTIQFVYLN